VKAIDDSWPPDDEVVARDLGKALGRGADTMSQGARETSRAGADAMASWRDAAGDKFGGKVDEFARSAGRVDQSMRNVAAHAERYGGELESAKTTITNTIAANERTHAQLANPMLGQAGPAMQKAHASKIASDLRTMVDEKAAGLVNGPGTNAATLAGQAQNGGITLEQLRKIMPNLSEKKAAEMLPHLNSAMAEAGINTPKRQAAFLAQLAHESGELRYFEEIASGAAYEGRKDLGNTQPGDGRRYKGRGPIQLTGRANYREAGQALGLDLEGNPKQVATPDVGFRTSGWYWESRDLNRLADEGDFRGITKRINGGTNGLAAREEYHERAKEALGV
jgi:putative chitinase